ncbi:MAG: hypothetical protein AAGD10_01085 [Myxococcota bacterium]
MNNKHTHAIIGGNGKTGRRITARLEARGEAVRSLGRSTEIRFDWQDPSTWRQPVSPEAYAEVLVPHMRRSEVEFMVELFVSLMDGYNSAPTNGVEQVLGRPATDFEHFAAKAAR